MHLSNLSKTTLRVYDSRLWRADDPELSYSIWWNISTHTIYILLPFPPTLISAVREKTILHCLLLVFDQDGVCIRLFEGGVLGKCLVGATDRLTTSRHRRPDAHCHCKTFTIHVVSTNATYSTRYNMILSYSRRRRRLGFHTQANPSVS